MQGATITEACDGSDDIFGLSTDSLSRLRSPSVLEVREKGYERLKEELAKAQRVSKKDILPYIIFKITIFPWRGNSNEIMMVLQLSFTCAQPPLLWGSI